MSTTEELAKIQGEEFATDCFGNMVLVGDIVLVKDKYYQHAPFCPVKVLKVYPKSNSILVKDPKWKASETPVLVRRTNFCLYNLSYLQRYIKKGLLCKGEDFNWREKTDA